MRPRFGAVAILLATGIAQAQTAPTALGAAWGSAMRGSTVLRATLDRRAIESLKGADVTARRRAATFLGEKDLAMFPELRMREVPEIDEERKALVAALSDAANGGEPTVSRAAVRSLATLLRNRIWGHHGEPWSDKKEVAPLVALGSVATPYLTELLLESELNYGVRFSILRTLKETRDPQAIEPLLRYIQEERGFALSEAFGVLATLEDPRIVPAIVENIDKEIGSYEDTPGVWALREIGKRAVPEIGEAATSHPRTAVRYYAAHTLVHVVDPRAVPFLVQALKDPSSEVRREAAKALGLQSGTPIIHLRMGLLDPNPQVRAAACLSLGYLKATSAFDALLLRLKDPDAEVRGRAVKALALIDGKRALRPILALKSDKPIQHLIANALGDIPGSEAEQGLIVLLRESDQPGKEEAAKQLGLRRSTRAIPDLVKAFLNEEGSLYVFEEALKGLAPQAATPLIAAFPSAKESVRYHLAKLLGATRDRRALPILRLLLFDDKLDWPAIEALGDLGDPAAIPWLRPLLPIKKSYEKGDVMESLGKLKDRGSIPELLRYLASDEHAHHAAVALGHIADPATLDPLLALLDRESLEGRWMVLDALGHFRDPRLVPILIKELEGAGGFGAAMALGRIGDPTALPALKKAVESDDERMQSAAGEAIKQIEKTVGTGG